jgi:hypothetical protein
MDVIFIGAVAFIVLGFYFRNIIKDHNNKNTNGNNSPNNPLPIFDPKINNGDDDFSEK